MPDLLRHRLATLAYRAGKAVRGAPPDFASFQASPAQHFHHFRHTLSQPRGRCRAVR